TKLDIVGAAATAMPRIDHDSAAYDRRRQTTDRGKHRRVVRNARSFGDSPAELAAVSHEDPINRVSAAKRRRTASCDISQRVVEPCRGDQRKYARALDGFIVELAG